MKANYNRKIKVDEKAVSFRTKDKCFCIYQNTVYGRLPNDKGVVYLDFEDETTLDKLINTLQSLKETFKEQNDDSKTES